MSSNEIIKLHGEICSLETSDANFSERFGVLCRKALGELEQEGAEYSQQDVIGVFHRTGAVSAARSKDEIISGFRKSKEAEQVEAHKRGLEAGREWVFTETPYESLKNLAEWRRTLSDEDWEYQMSEEVNSAYCAAERMVFIMFPDLNEDRITAESFWEEAIGDDYRRHIAHDGFARGFAEGAIAVWEEFSASI